MDNTDDMAYSSQLVPDDGCGCGDAGDVGFLQNADSEPLDFQGFLHSALVFQLSHSALDKCLCLGVGLPFVSTAVVVLLASIRCSISCRCHQTTSPGVSWSCSQWFPCWCQVVWSYELPVFFHILSGANFAGTLARFPTTSTHQKKDSVGIDIPNTFFAKSAFPEHVILANPGIKVPKQKDLIFFRDVR